MVFYGCLFGFIDFWGWFLLLLGLNWLGYEWTDLDCFCIGLVCLMGFKIEVCYEVKFLWCGWGYGFWLVFIFELEAGTECSLELVWDDGVDWFWDLCFLPIWYSIYGVGCEVVLCRKWFYYKGQYFDII